MLNPPAADAPLRPALFALLARLRRATGCAAGAVAGADGRPTDRQAEAIRAVHAWQRAAAQRAVQARLQAMASPEALPAGDPGPVRVTLPRHAFDALLRDRESASALKALFDGGDLLLLAFDARAPHCVREVSPGLRQHLQARPGQPVGQPLATLFAPDSAQRLLQVLMPDRQHTTVELQLAASGGWWQLRAGPPDAQGVRPACLLDLQPVRRAQAEAVAQQRRARRTGARLARAERLRDELLRLAAVLPRLADDAAVHGAIADAASRIFPGWRGALWLAEDDEAPLCRVLQWPGSGALVEDEVPGQMLCLPLAGGLLPAGPDAPGQPRGTLQLVCDIAPPADERASWRADAQAFATLLQTQLAQRALARALRERALRDAVTGLPGPREFEAALARETARLRRSEGRQALALAQVAIEDFDDYRLAGGAVAGDTLLREVAQALRRFARQDDTVCRLDGAAFALLLPGAAPAAAQARLSQLRLRLSQRPAGGLPRPLLEIGVVEVQGDEREPSDLLRRARCAASPVPGLRAAA